MATTRETTEERLRSALQSVLQAASEMQRAIDSGDVEDAMEWLSAISTDSTDALNSIDE